MEPVYDERGLEMCLLPTVYAKTLQMYQWFLVMFLFAETCSTEGTIVLERHSRASQKQALVQPIHENQYAPLRLVPFSHISLTLPNQEPVQVWSVHVKTKVKMGFLQYDWFCVGVKCPLVLDV